MGGYEAIDFKQAINDYGLLIANLAIKKQNANKYKILKVVLGGVEQWKNYCADNENLGLPKEAIEYIKTVHITIWKKIIIRIQSPSLKDMNNTKARFIFPFYWDGIYQWKY